jgi:hypothetical protein
MRKVFVWWFMTGKNNNTHSPLTQEECLVVALSAITIHRSRSTCYKCILVRHNNTHTHMEVSLSRTHICARAYVHISTSTNVSCVCPLQYHIIICVLHCWSMSCIGAFVTVWIQYNCLLCRSGTTILLQHLDVYGKRTKHTRSTSF